ncbi:hypothetical protein SAMN06265377_3173 [Flagellimonas pacifica]|uniref:Uncharacterized protein n=2 Tax=Flagellimonas pacifica TaxID=1247520 RepID=A0A285MVW7_9FLAO|nr:hypothetical protein SAMN06265377_3173 [Allomuricauda parva]
MALIVLLSTFSFTLDNHYCGDVLVDSSFFGAADSCGMEVQKESSSLDCGLAKKKCCSDETILFDGQDDLKISFEKLSFEQQQFIAAYILTALNSFDGLQENVVPFRGYPPPLLVKDILILDQTFLI